MTQSAIDGFWNNGDRGGFYYDQFRRVIEHRRINELNGEIEDVDIDSERFCAAGF